MSSESKREKATTITTLISGSQYLLKRCHQLAAEQIEGLGLPLPLKEGMEEMVKELLAEIDFHSAIVEAYYEAFEEDELDIYIAFYEGPGAVLIPKMMDFGTNLHESVAVMTNQALEQAIASGRLQQMAAALRARLFGEETDEKPTDN
jgi:hypothetical protein